MSGKRRRRCRRGNCSRQACCCRGVCGKSESPLLSWQGPSRSMRDEPYGLMAYFDQPRCAWSVEPLVGIRSWPVISVPRCLGVSTAATVWQALLPLTTAGSVWQVVARASVQGSAAAAAFHTELWPCGPSPGTTFISEESQTRTKATRRTSVCVTPPRRLRSACSTRSWRSLFLAWG